MPTPQKISTNIFMVGSGTLSGMNDCCIYAIRTASGVCLIDTGTGNGGMIMKNIKDAGLAEKPITHIVLTHAHYDHVGAAWQFKKILPNIKIIAHQEDVDAIEGKTGTEALTAAAGYHAKLTPVKVDVVLTKDVEELDIGGTKATIYHTPGHTPGSISVLVNDDGKKILFGQDIHGPFLPEFKSDVQAWAKSMKILAGLNADILCEGHFGVYDGAGKVKDFIGEHMKDNGFSL
ncbi:MAG: MBL fold metallo-hydrolase [Candidatus Lokiarchaeota archaeon]|nr:MBL fold metallo-hydrolase [Candidatus Lokiarchaeota archaeon]